MRKGHERCEFINESTSDVQRLQNDINQLSTWSQGALMNFNTNKCVVLRLHPQQPEDKNPQYQLNGERLRCVSHQRDLGVIVDETIKPYRQCVKAAKTANPIMRAVKAWFMNITPTLFDKLYGSSSAPTWNIHSNPGGRGLKRTLGC